MPSALPEYDKLFEDSRNRIAARLAQNDQGGDLREIRTVQADEVENRGIIGDIGATIAGGVYDAGEMVLRGARALPGGAEPGDDSFLSRSIEKMEAFKEETPWLQNKQREGVSRWVREGGRSAATSMTAAGAGAAAGAGIGAAFGGIGALPGASLTV